jgi:hypothetical protein
MNYNEIKNRTGKTENGVFVKEEKKANEIFCKCGNVTIKNKVKYDAFINDELDEDYILLYTDKCDKCKTDNRKQLLTY